MSGSRLVVVGDALLDRDLEGTVERLSPEAPVPIIDEPVQRCRPGGAGLAAALARRDGHQVVVITALSQDEPAGELRTLLREAAVDLVDLGLRGATPEKIRVRAAGRSLFRLDRGGGGSVGSVTGEALSALRDADGVLVSDYGRGVAQQMRPALEEAARRRPLVWDPHPRGAVPVAGARLVTPNREEARRFAGDGDADEGLPAVTALARRLLDAWRVAGVAITMGDRGALLASSTGAPLVVPARRVPVADPCGAGDRFASAAAGLLARGALPTEAVTGAVALASRFVAEGGAAAVAGAPTDPPHPETAEELAATIRAQGGTVVATSGCFDLLHAGHVATLRAARGLGDCLIVCLNSDRSVRRLKGPGRPLVPQEDRAALLSALDPVDAVVQFDEDTPEAVLHRLRPDIFAKGGDYALADLPEARVLESWGGQAVILPYVDGRSTSGLMKEVVRRGIR